MSAKPFVSDLHDRPSGGQRIDEASGNQLLLAEIAKELKVLGQRRFEQQVLEDGIHMDEALSQHLADSFALQAKAVDQKSILIQAVVANSQDSTKASRARATTARDEYLATLRKRLVHGESEIKRLQEYKHKLKEQCQGLSPNCAGAQRSERAAAQQLRRFLADATAACATARAQLL